MYKKLSILVIIPLATIIFLLGPTQASALTYHLTLEQLILNEIQLIQHPAPPSQVSNIAITASLVQPTATPTVTLVNQINTSQPTTTSTNSISLDDVQKYIMDAINTYRASQGLPPVQPSTETCNFAKTRAQEIASNFSHDGFTQRNNNHTLPYATWTKVTENLAETSNYHDVVNLWANSPGHAANMRADTPYVCVAEYQNYYAYEGMHP